MRRRHFLGFLGIGILLVLVRRLGLPGKRSGPQPVSYRFHAAGVRFQETTGSLAEGEPIEVRRARFAEETCYELYNAHGERIGFVPKRLVRDLKGKPIRRAFLSGVRPFAVPWERVQVTLELG